MARRERKPHWLGATDGGELPKHITYVGISSERIETPAASHSWEEHGRMMALVSVRYDRAEPEVYDSFTLGTGIEAWGPIAGGLYAKRLNWLYFRDLHRAMTLLDGWECVERKTIRYQASCLQDPPIWIRCVIGGKPCLLTDSRNYGDECKANCGTAKDIEGAKLSFWFDTRKCWESWAEYEAADIRQYIEPIYQSVAGLGGCGWKPTVSGLAWSLYRRHFIPMTDDPWEEEAQA